MEESRQDLICRIAIMEGHKNSSAFWFRAVQIDESRKEKCIDEMIISDGFSVHEDDVIEYLAYFLLKHFDSNLNYNYLYRVYAEFYEKDCDVEFEWNVVENFYTYSVAEKMCQDILRITELLNTDYENPELLEFKKQLKLRSKEVNPNVVYYIDIITDFYERFVKRMRKLMKQYPAYNTLTVSGP